MEHSANSSNQKKKFNTFKESTEKKGESTEKKLKKVKQTFVYSKRKRNEDKSSRN